MGSKRVGLARVESLIEGLKRDLALGSTTLNSATLKGCTITGDHTVTGTGIDAFSRTDETTWVLLFQTELLLTVPLI